MTLGLVTEAKHFCETNTLRQICGVLESAKEHQSLCKELYLEHFSKSGMWIGIPISEVQHRDPMIPWVL